MDYKATVFLPKTSFLMKANLANRELDFLKFWSEIKLYEKTRLAYKGRQLFTLHDGPPYANGNLHLGHALNKILKDIIIRQYRILGYDVPFIPGWDCHGLPIEWKVEEEFRNLGIDRNGIDILEFRNKCRSFAKSWIKIQSNEFQRIGILGDWENPYTTMSYENESIIVEQLLILLEKGIIYRDLKPVLWSNIERTALAEAEIEYYDKYSNSIYVLFPIVYSKNNSLIKKKVSAVIWTTTPWTIPGNRAVAYNRNYKYLVLYIPSSDRRLLISQESIKNLDRIIIGEDFIIEDYINGYSLLDTLCKHPLYDESNYNLIVPFIPSDHVTSESGTGLVHIAPGHGIEDFELGKRWNIEICNLVDSDGTYNNSIPIFHGKNIFKEEENIIELISKFNNLLYREKIKHSYPHSWRSKSPLIFRVTDQWFLDFKKNGLKEKVLEEVDKVRWFPINSKNRIKSMLEKRPDWCLSRQRSWGVPITFFINKKTRKILIDKEVNNKIINSIRLHGSDIWYESNAELYLSPKYNPDQYEKVKDVLDVWFDSSCTIHFILKNSELNTGFPADLYIEGSDQHRGWFQVSLIESCASLGESPYKQVITHGFVLDEKGYKLSKSLNNFMSLDKIIDSYGSEILRLWIVFSDVFNDIRISREALKKSEDIYRRFRNTFKYLLGSLNQSYNINISNINIVEENKEELLLESIDNFPLLEKWILHRISNLESIFQSCSKDFNFLNFYNELHIFCTNDLSSFYFDIRKDSLYCDSKKDFKRKSVYYTMHNILNFLLKWLSPVLCFTTEEVYQIYYKERGRKPIYESVHLKNFFEAPKKWHQMDICNSMKKVREIRCIINSLLEESRVIKREIRSSLEAVIQMSIDEETKRFFVKNGITEDMMAELNIVSKFHISICSSPHMFKLQDNTFIDINVKRASGNKCERCWKILEEVGFYEFKDLCSRCNQLLLNDYID